MVKLIVGKKGAGKTKILIDLINKAAMETEGKLVCIEKGLKLTYDISHQVRLINVDSYKVAGFDSFYGFVAGIFAGNYDITELFIDSTLKIGGTNLQELEKFVSSVEALAEENKANVVITVSADASELPERLKKYII